MPARRAFVRKLDSFAAAPAPLKLRKITSTAKPKAITVGHRYTSAPKMVYSFTERNHARAGNAPKRSVRSVEIAIASHGHKGALPRRSIHPVKKPRGRPKVLSVYSIMPPDMGIAAVSSPKTIPIGTKNSAPIANAIIAGYGPPPRIIQSPTKRTHPVPIIAPNPMVKKLKSDNDFFISGATLFVSAMPNSSRLYS